ncbi:MAG: amphi-Trp domain-containing protein [Aridibacter sp.]
MAQANKPVKNSGEKELVFKEKDQAPEKVADRLREIADMIEKGSVELEGQNFEIPENVFVKVELEEEHNGDIAPINFEIEVEIVFPVVMTVDN